MASARHVLKRLKASDGRIRIKTLSGVSALVAAIALLVGILPAIASHSPGGPLVNPVVVDYGGGSGACAASLTVGSEVRLPSAASREFHINNPQVGTHTHDGITVTVRDRTALPAGRVFDFTVSGASGFVVYDVIVNGGAQNNHYDYDTTYPGRTAPPGPVDHDNNLSAPKKNNRSLYNLSHVNICYDVPGVAVFVCGADPVSATRFGDDEGDFTGATVQVFTINGETECQKRGSFFIQNSDETTLDFGIGEGEVVGRADFFKEFDSSGPFDPLVYNGGPLGGFEEVPWCSADGSAHAGFPELDESPELPAVSTGHTACKVFEKEGADGRQHTVVYFRFEDPQFR